MSTTIRYAASDDDVIAIHKFLCVVAGPTLPGPIEAKKSITEIWRVVQEDVALMAIKDGKLVGTLGLTKAGFWWGDVSYLANRWFFTLPGSRSGKPLLKEAKGIAIDAGLELHLIAEERGTVTILNKSKHRSTSKGVPHVSRQQSDHTDADQDPARVVDQRGNG